MFVAKKTSYLPCFKSIQELPNNHEVLNLLGSKVLPNNKN